MENEIWKEYSKLLPPRFGYSPQILLAMKKKKTTTITKQYGGNRPLQPNGKLWDPKLTVNNWQE